MKGKRKLKVFFSRLFTTGFCIDSDDEKRKLRNGQNLKVTLFFRTRFLFFPLFFYKY